ncbi:hypothetical protein A6E01_20070 (plasmid) [Vibrio breoganii]|uniref:Uncharacterized protein n=1 Tax=Vibrio breoganii TaxID=553239 RepID=A0AAN1CUG7_9VIBR|nr:hypothetical protein [Vibrio breoganii]ANO35512.1 hypothetical protein A6E01_20070 [Vibrio breoganii]
MDLATSLRKLESEMESFTSPDNKDGFYRKFCFWVYKTWSKCEFVDTEVVDVGYDCSTHPVRTGQLASEKCKTYKDFINSNTGNSVCTFTSGSGMACESYEQKLYEVFGDACSEKLNQLIELHGLSVPDRYKEDCEDINELIFCGIVDHLEDPELDDVCQDIVCRFGSFGIDVSSYMCEIRGVADDGEYIFDDDSIFADMTLDDFKSLVVV